MAQRDKSQGFGFVYTNLGKLLAERDFADESSSASAAPVIVPQKGSYNFNKDREPAKSAPVTEARSEKMAAAQQIRENLDRLQSLHHKLHAMLEELNTITNRDKKKRT